MKKFIFSGDPEIKKMIKYIDSLICPVCGAKGWEFSLYNLKPAYGKYCSGSCLRNSLEKNKLDKTLE